MNSDRLYHTLCDLGLSEKEASIYLASLSLGPCTILEISKASGVKRTTAYSIIEALKTKGLFRSEIKGFKTKYVAESPEKLQLIISQKKRNLDELMPDFSALYNIQGGSSFIKHYEGLEAMKEVYNGLIRDVRPKEDYLIISDQEKWYNLDAAFFEDFMRRRAMLDINIRLLLVDSPIAREYQQKQHIYNEIIKILPKDTELTTNLVVIPHKVVIHQLVPPIFAMVIENRSIVQMAQQFFRIIWKAI